jgi:hypothetical protein
MDDGSWIFLGWESGAPRHVVFDDVLLQVLSRTPDLWVGKKGSNRLVICITVTSLNDSGSDLVALYEQRSHDFVLEVT